MEKEKIICPLCWIEETELVKDDKPCIKCQSDMQKGFLMIGVDFSKSEDAENPVRSGHRWVVKPEAGAKLFNKEAFEKGAGFLDIEEAKQLGLPVSKLI